MKTANPHGHPFPHAKLNNVKLTPISRLTKNTDGISRHLIANSDVRNYAISKAAEVAKHYGWRAAVN